MNTPRTDDEIPKSALRAARLAAGLTQIQLAVAAGVGLSSVTTGERAPAMLSDRTARRCAQVLGVPAASLRAQP